MPGKSVIFLTLCLMLPTSRQCSGQTPATGLEPAGPEAVVVHVYDYAHVPAEILAKAQREATRIFQKAGVKVLWLECFPPTPPVACGSLPAPRHFLLNIHTRFTSGGGMALAHEVIGFALVPAGQVGVSFSRAKDFIRWDADLPQILGHVMAHELGHLLLGSPQHSETGIMRASWYAQQWKQAGHGDLLFTSEQGERMRAQLLDLLGKQSLRSGH